jgi:hypothetical protein
MCLSSWWWKNAGERSGPPATFLSGLNSINTSTYLMRFDVINMMAAFSSIKNKLYRV